MKQTAAEWLFEKLWNTDKDKFTWHTILKQAKEMEKEQIINAREALFHGTPEQYYNETFKQQEQ